MFEWSNLFKEMLLYNMHICDELVIYCRLFITTLKHLNLIFETWIHIENSFLK
jgi:hypothetical protein